MKATMMASVRNRVVSILMAMLMVLSCATTFAPKAEAATGSNGKNTQTITVTTKSNWWRPGSESITLAQSKGTRTSKTYSFWKGWREKTTNCYGTWKIVAKSTDNKDTVKQTLKDSSVKIKLKADKTYKITVSWDSDKDTIDSVTKGSFSSLPSGWVKSTNKVSEYW